MPDRYGETDEPDPITAADRELYAVAMTVRCAYCGAESGTRCVNKRLPDHPPTRIPHTTRTNSAIEVPF